MSDSTAVLQREIDSAEDLQSVVRTMKALATSGIGLYERSLLALDDYSRTVELGLCACLQENNPSPIAIDARGSEADCAVGAIVFGSDQGLVGHFNEVVAGHAIETLSAGSGKYEVWAVGGRVYACLLDAGLPLAGLFPVPTSVKAISALVGQIQHVTGAQLENHARVHAIYNRLHPGGLCEPYSRQLLPLDAEWQRMTSELQWPWVNPVEVVSREPAAISALTREYLFNSLYRACAESLVSENVSRLAAMMRADKSIDDLLENLHGAFHQLCQSGDDKFIGIADS